MTTRIHKLNLLENSHSFMAEAARNAISARADICRWPFSILNVVQATELSLKEFLRRQHPLLIYEDIDNPKKTVTFSKALQRTEKVLDQSFPESERKKIVSAIRMRNQITHHEFEISEEAAMAKFSELFAFWSFFQSRYLEIEVEDALDCALLDGILEIEKCFSDLKQKALDRITDEEIDDANILGCPDCMEETLVTTDGINCRCYLCRNVQILKECPRCMRIVFEFDIQDFSHLLDSDVEEGIGVMLNDYGYNYYKACSACFPKIESDIEHKRDAEYYERMEAEHYCRNL